MSSYYNNIPIYETLNINYGNIETLDAETIKTKNLFIDTLKTNEDIKTQKITLDNKDIEDLTISTTAPYTDNNKKICSKGYIDEALSGKASTGDLVGQKYYVSDTLKGERFNDYTHNEASGDYSHCEGYSNKALGDYSHCEGATNTVSGNRSHCEGQSNTITGSWSHCEGQNNTVSGSYSHCEGYGNKTTTDYTHATGYYTQADKVCQTAIGKYNTTNNTNALLSVGNGTNDARSDALVVKSTGEVIINSTATNTTPKLTIGTSKSITGTTALSSSTQTNDDKLATQYYVDNGLSGKANIGDIPDISNCLTTSNILIFNDFRIRIRYKTGYNVYQPYTIQNVFGYAIFDTTNQDLYFTGDVKIPSNLDGMDTTTPYFCISFLQIGTNSSKDYYPPNDTTPSSCDLLAYANGLWKGLLSKSTTAGGIDNPNYLYVYHVQYIGGDTGDIYDWKNINNGGSIIRLNMLKFTKTGW